MPVQVLEVSVATQHAFTTQTPSLIQQRREVLAHPNPLERLGHHSEGAEVELLPSPKNRPNGQEIVPISMSYHDHQGPRSDQLDEQLIPDTQGIPGVTETAIAL